VRTAELPAPATTAGAGADPVVRVRGLEVTFRRAGRAVRAVRGVDLDVARGEIVGLVGESGSGKSVLGTTLLGLLPDRPAPTVRGEAVVCGVDMVTADAATRRRLRRDSLGAVFQDPMSSLNPSMTVGRQVAEAAGSGAHAVRLLEAAGIPDPESRLKAYPHQLSGGLRQRVMIAMAVARDPALVVADEPTTALDVTVQAQILELVRRLRDVSGTSFLFTTHDLGVAASVADRIAVMYAGEVLETGPALDVLTRPQHPYTAGLLRSRIALDSPRDRPLPVTPAAASARDTDAPAQDAGPAPDAWPEPAPVKGSYALEVAGVEVVYRTGRGRRARSVHALRGVDLRVRPGESVAVVGESGSGKSTLLRVVAGLVEPTAGDVAAMRHGRPQVVFQDAGASMTPWLTVGDLLTERLQVAGVPRAEHDERVRATLRLVGLPAEALGARAAQLSGGQRQRAAIARAVVVPPEVLLCDEPTSALDVSLAAGVLNLIGDLRRRLGMAVVFVTHDLAAARVVADRVVVMQDGTVVEEVAAEDLVTAATHPYTRTLLAAYPAAPTPEVGP